MKYKVLIPVILLAAIAGILSFKLFDSFGLTKSENQHQVIQKTVIKILESGHYSPADINDEFSEKVFDKMVESMDFEKKFFLQSDIDGLSKKYKSQIDNQILNNDINYFNDISTIFTNRVNQAEQIYKPILKAGFDFTGKDEYESDPEHIAFAKDEKELTTRWKEYLKFRVLSKFFELKKEQEKLAKDEKKSKIETDAVLKKKAAESIEKAMDRYFKRLKKMNENDRFAIYMNSITEAFDPHTSFMQPTDKKKFDEMMSGSFIGIGATLQQQDDGRVKITSIVTGSPAWQQGSLKADDIIEKVGQGNEPPIEIDGYDIDEIIKMIRGKEGTTVQLSVVKPDGSRQVIPIKRGKVDIENVFAKSAIINEDGKRIGYILLPEFYSNFGDASDRKSSTDMEKEVRKLMDEGVDGIVIDLRNNGGGSLSDVVDIAGLFIGSGPVVQVRSSGNNTMTLRSKRPQALYTGPLAIMINKGSASASEILAAAIQDYGRGVIIGTTSFGKGTVQKIISLDQFVSNQDKKMIIENLQKGNKDAVYDGVGSLKLTIQKFYRINGGSTQLKGVEPDIYLPDAFDFLEDIGEKKEKSALPWDKILAADYSPMHKGISFEFLKSNSQKRVETSPAFKLINKTAEKLKERKDNTFVPLNEIAFGKKMKENEELTKKVESLDSLNTGLTVINLKVDEPKINLDETSKENNNKWLKAIKGDPHIHESSHILFDLMMEEPIQRIGGSR